MTPKLTPWFPGTVKPVRVGVYQRNLKISTLTFTTSHITYSYWNGRFFGFSESTVDNAYAVRHHGASCQDLPWRGLAVKP